MTGDRECPDCGELTLFEKGTGWICTNYGAEYTSKEMDEFESEDKIEE